MLAGLGGTWVREVWLIFLCALIFRKMFTADAGMLVVTPGKVANIEIEAASELVQEVNELFRNDVRFA
jgi:hypothetical protein